MAKKKQSISLLYLIGMALVVIGFCCPMFKFPSAVNGFKFINFDNFGFTTIGALVLILGGIVGLAWALLPLLRIKLPASDLVKTIAVLALVVGIVVLIVGFTQDKVYTFVGKKLLKHALYGFYICVGGVVIAFIGKFIK